MIAGDIGYNVDGAENGVWLPTHAKAVIVRERIKQHLEACGGFGLTFVEPADFVG